MNDTTEKRCQLNEYPDGIHRLCGRIGVGVWHSRDGDLVVCEQCEAVVREVQPWVKISEIKP